MDASAALSELVALSTQVVEAVVTGPDGVVEAARTAEDERARRLAAAGAELLAEASSLRPGGRPSSASTSISGAARSSPSPTARA